MSVARALFLSLVCLLTSIRCGRPSVRQEHACEAYNILRKSANLILNLMSLAINADLLGKRTYLFNDSGLHIYGCKVYIYIY